MKSKQQNDPHAWPYRQAEVDVLIERINRLRGLCKTAVGMLYDAGREHDAERLANQIGDMEKRR